MSNVVKNIEWISSKLHKNDWRGIVGEVWICEVVISDGGCYDIVFNTRFDVRYNGRDYDTVDNAKKAAEDYYTNYVKDFLDKFVNTKYLKRTHRKNIIEDI